MKRKLSIIVPYYNASEFVDCLLNSLNNQTVNDFEVIFINDASSKEDIKKFNDKLKKCKFLYKMYTNIKNSGPGASRNIGIKKSNCEYLTFVDADDYISSNFVEKIINIISINAPDLILFDYYMVDVDKYIKKKFLTKDNKFIDKDYVLALTTGMCWGKVYLKSIILENNINFPTIIRGEDLAFVKVFISKCKKNYYLADYLYYYVKNTTSIMHRTNTLNINDNITAYNYMISNIEFNESIEMVYIREYLYLVTQIMILKKYKKDDIIKHIDKFFLAYPNWGKNKFIKYQPFYMKILLFFIKNKILFPLKIAFKFKK